MFPSDSRHDGEVRVNATGSMAAANDAQSTLVYHVPIHGAPVVDHGVPMACHALVDRGIAVQSARRAQPVDDLREDTMIGIQVQGNGRVVGVEARRMWMVHALGD